MYFDLQRGLSPWRLSVDTALDGAVNNVVPQPVHPVTIKPVFAGNHVVSLKTAPHHLGAHPGANNNGAVHQVALPRATLYHFFRQSAMSSSVMVACSTIMTTSAVRK